MTNEKLNNSKARVEQVTSNQASNHQNWVWTFTPTASWWCGSWTTARPQPAQKFTSAKFREWSKGKGGWLKRSTVATKPVPFGYGLHRDLVKLGCNNLVVQPVCLDERHTGVNHDKGDARELALRLDRYVAGNSHALATVRVPTPAEEQKRIASRQREQLKREVRRLAAQGRSLLLTQGYRAKGGWWGARRVGPSFRSSCRPGWTSGWKCSGAC